MFDRDVSEGVVQKLMQLKQALHQGDLNKASSVQVCKLLNLNGDYFQQHEAWSESQVSSVKCY
jgi:hypothetical protein